MITDGGGCLAYEYYDKHKEAHNFLKRILSSYIRSILSLGLLVRDGRGVVNSLPSLGLQVIRTKVSISLQCEKPVIQSSPLAILVLLTSSITTEVVKRNGWCSGLRNQSSGNVKYHRPVRECSWYKKTKACLEFATTLSCVYSLCFSHNIYNIVSVWWCGAFRMLAFSDGII